MEHWKELVPVDRYIVHSADILHDYDRKIITLLYQPLIGSKAFSLYITLWSELEQNKLWSEDNTHHSLMVLLQSNLKEIYQERLKLEGIGLLKTYVKSHEDERSFIYELQAPLSPSRFFTDGVLNVFLYNRLGKNKFLKVKRFFSDKQLDSKLYSPITKTFNEVFSSVKPREMISSMNEETISSLEVEADTRFADRNKGSSIEIGEDLFDFSLFFAGISEVMIPRKSITGKVKEAIKKLSFLYSINPIDMQGIVMSALDQTEAIDIEKLRKSARDWYQFENGNDLPSLSERIQPIPYRVMNSEPKTKDEQLMKQLETMSPRQFLTDISGGIQPTAIDLKVIEDVMFHQQLLPGVVNVLIYYVMLKTDMKLSKNYVEKIASQWARKEIKTVRDAMAIAKEENRQYQEWAQSNKKQRGRPKKNSQTEPKGENASTRDSEDLTEEKRQLQKRMKKLRESLNLDDDFLND